MKTRLPAVFSAPAESIKERQPKLRISLAYVAVLGVFMADHIGAISLRRPGFQGLVNEVALLRPVCVQVLSTRGHASLSCLTQHS